MISITNAGRGAGKTYQLIQWAKEDPNRRIIGFGALREQMKEAGIIDQYIHVTETKKHLQGRHDITGVGFDNFGIPLEDLLHEYYGVHPKIETILSFALSEKPVPTVKQIKQAQLTEGVRVIIRSPRSSFNGKSGVILSHDTQRGYGIRVKFDKGTTGIGSTYFSLGEVEPEA